MAFAILFFLTPMSLGNVGNELLANDRVRLVDHTSEPGLRPVTVEYDIEQSGYHVLAQNDTPRLIDIVTVFTNLTETVYLIAEKNNTLLNVKEHFWIKVHKNCTIISIGKVYEGNLFAERVQDFGKRFRMLYDGYFYEVILRQIDSATDIEELREEFPEFDPEIQTSIVVTWLFQLSFGGFIAMVVIGRWRMNTL